MKLSTLKVLSDAEIRELHEATMEILTQCGVKILNVRMLDFLEEKGLNVDRQTQIVTFTRSCLENALGTIPSAFDLYNRNGELAFTLGKGDTKVAAGHNAVFWLDGATGQTRPSTVADVELFARICDQLDTIDMIGIPVMPQDVPHPRASLLYGVRACVENSTKPIFFSTDSERVNHACIEILRTVFKGDLSRQPYGISQLSPTSPLFWEKSVIDAIMDTIAAELIQRIGPQGDTYLTQEHTLKWLRSGEYLKPRLTVRGPFASWKAKGAKTTAQLAREHVQKCADFPAPHFPDEHRQTLDDILSSLVSRTD